MGPKKTASIGTAIGIFIASEFIIICTKKILYGRVCLVWRTSGLSSSLACCRHAPSFIRQIWIMKRKLSIIIINFSISAVIYSLEFVVGARSSMGPAKALPQSPRPASRSAMFATRA